MKTLFIFITLFVGAIAYKKFSWVGLMLVVYPAVLFSLAIISIGNIAIEFEEKFFAMKDMYAEINKWIIHATCILKNSSQKKNNV